MVEERGRRNRKNAVNDDILAVSGMRRCYLAGSRYPHPAGAGAKARPFFKQALVPYTPSGERGSKVIHFFSTLNKCHP